MAGDFSRASHDHILWMLANNGGKIKRSKLRAFFWLPHPQMLFQLRGISINLVSADC
jgi:hypothetical protein